MTEDNKIEVSFLLERLELALGRIREIPEEQKVLLPYRTYFESASRWILNVEQHKEELSGQYFEKNPLLFLQERNRSLYDNLLGENYEVSFGNPAWACKQLGEYGRSLSFLHAELSGLIPAVYEGRIFDETVLLELFLEIYTMFADSELPEPEQVRKTIYWYLSDYCDEFQTARTGEQLDPEADFAVSLIETADLTDLRYLYRFGEYITENELGCARFLNTLSEDEIQKMAQNITEGYRKGFELARKSLSAKKTVQIICHLGFERLVRAVCRSFRKMGLVPVIPRYATHAILKRGNRRGFSGAVPNQQYEYDHRNDLALFLDDDLNKRMLRSLQVSYEKYKMQASWYSGPCVIETFGETPFEPAANPWAAEFSEGQQKLKNRFASESGQISNRYLPYEETSYLVIDYPLPEIGENYPEIFREIIRINTLDAKVYGEIQEKLINALNRGTRVHVTGRGENRTDLWVSLYRLTNPTRQTIFENCLADVNIPLGEVFTSPRLSGTNGLLHVNKVYLEGLLYKNLQIRLTDGMISSCSVSNFDSEKENQKFLRENLLYHHKTLPIGEFAIGTNTVAYRAGQKYKIADKLPILIAEKTGPHFAMGDTCYSWSEDIPVYNPDGKEIVARDNEVSLLRKTDPAKAYFHCHTDITIPYDELGSIIVYCADGKTIKLMEEGRFVLPGTEMLNEALDEE